MKSMRVVVKPLFLVIVMWIITFASAAAVPAASDKILILYLKGKDAPASALYTNAELTDHYFGAKSPVRRFWTEASYGRYQYTGKVVGPIELPVNEADIKPLPPPAYNNVIDYINEKLKPTGIPTTEDVAPYDRVFILLGSSKQGQFGGGFANREILVNGKMVKKYMVSFAIKKSDYMHGFYYEKPGAPYKGKYHDESISYPDLGLWGFDQTMLHEWAHSLELRSHANFFTVTDEPLGGTKLMATYGSKPPTEEYGNYFDIMGTGKYAMHPNAYYKFKIGWLTEADIIRIKPTPGVNIDRSQEVKITPLSSSSGKRAVVIQPFDPTITLPAPIGEKKGVEFWIEWRTADGFDKHLGHPWLKSNTEGVMVNMAWTDPLDYGLSWLIDLNPDNSRTANGEDDHHEVTLNANMYWYSPEGKFLIYRPSVSADGTMTFRVGYHQKVAGLKPGVHPMP